GRLATEELFPETGSEEHHAPTLEHVLRADPAAGAGHFVAHLAILGADPANGGIGQTVTERDGKPTHRFQAGGLDQRDVFPNQVQVRFFEHYVLASALTSCLLAGLSGPADDRSLAEGVKGGNDHGPKPSAVSDQQGDSGNTPRDPQHGEETTQRLAAQCGPGLDEDFAEHFLPPAVSFQLSAFSFGTFCPFRPVNQLKAES